ncbi:hypothetical protein COU75_04675 [Candidatus Peregrinibacteria bacterium CG10_big_fil_rev_8_21_14_0_10_42_8]|nr:MAG: hypothetical protein COU75_04675 [Candidatus Peregrinibacteria bacterium CG10_big_fil_rev_8_21_14_0_10_42_8]
MYSSTITGLILLACVSPFLTLATLWQKKEWRIDRLKEHMRSKGWLRQTFGIIRPVIVIASIASSRINLPLSGLVIGLYLLAGMSLLQIITRRQRVPVWTMKAVVLCCTSLFINILLIQSEFIAHISYFLPPYFSVLLPILQFIPLTLSWILLLPIDIALKQHIMKKASVLRSSHKNLTVIGITGSVGKTTTKELIAHILKEKNVLSTPAYVNSEMGVAKWILKELPKHSKDKDLILIIEMGAYRMGEIENLCSLTKPSIGVITYIGTQHIALFGSQEKLQKAKRELFTALPENGHALFNADCEPCKSVARNLLCKTTPVSASTVDSNDSSNGIRFNIKGQQYSIPLHGIHNVTNVLLAIEVAKLLGLQSESIAKSLTTFSPPHSTFAVRSQNGITLLDDTHNASPESFQAAITWAASQPMHNKILLTPGLIEQGVAEDKIHTELGSQANGVFSRVIFTGKHGRDAFAKGYTGTVEQYTRHTVPVTNGDLLVCIGRVSPTIIKHIV